MAITPDQVRNAMRFWTTGVTVVTGKHAGEIHGMTVSSFTSLSLDPPLVLVSLEKGARTHNLVKNGGVFAVTILASDQGAISDRFAGRETEVTDRLAGLATHTLTTGCPLLDGGLAFVDCRLTATYDAGTHTIFIGEIVALEVNGAIEGMMPLVYFDRGYRRLGE